LEPSGLCNVPELIFFPLPQQLQPGPWPMRLGLSALRSFVACAPFKELLMKDRFGAVNITRGAGVAQSGQSYGLSKNSMDTSSEKGPQLSQRYS